MNNFQSGDEWLEYEQGGLHEHRSDLIQEVDVLMPRLGIDGVPFVVAEIQKYRAKNGKALWRSLTPKRETFRDGYTSRERCAQELVRDCKRVRERIAYRKLRLQREANTPSV